MKSWYVSKTLWVNLIAIIVLSLQGLNADFVIPPEIQAGILGIINLILRVITKQPIDWATPAKPADTAAGFISLRLLPLLALAALLMVAAGCATTGTVSPATGTTATTAPISSVEQAQIAAAKTLYAIETTLHLSRTSIDASYTGGLLDAAAYNKITPVYNRVLASAKSARRILKLTIDSGGSPDTSSAYAGALAYLLTDKVALVDLMTALGVKEPTP